MYQSINLPYTIDSQDNNSQHYEIPYLCKRVVDISLTLLALIALAPIMIAIAIAIRCDSPGPIFFVQQRVGSRRRKLNGRVYWEPRLFPFIKFRSMKHNVDQTPHVAQVKAWISGTLDSESNESSRFKIANDTRITSVGKFLRKSSLDELPQLFNILRGDMSLVGPRPVPPYEAEEYRDWQLERLCAVPGLTGSWQINGRGFVRFEEMIHMDIDYIKHQSIWLDLKIILLTVPVVFTGRGAK